MELWCIAHKIGLREGLKECGSYKNAIEWLKTEGLGVEWRVR